MLQGNAGLKPKEGEVTSRPWQWPINYRVSNRLVVAGRFGGFGNIDFKVLLIKI